VSVSINAQVSVKELDVEEENGVLVVTAPGSDALRVGLPEGHEADDVRCQFDSKKRELKITVPCPGITDPGIIECGASNGGNELETANPNGQEETGDKAEVKVNTPPADCPTESPVKPAMPAVATPPATASSPVATRREKQEKPRREHKSHAEQISQSTTKAGEKAAAKEGGLAGSEIETAVAMGQSMAERLREQGATSDGDAMASVMARLQKAMAGGVSQGELGDIEAELDSLLARASEGMPDDLVKDIKEKAPERWAQPLQEQQSASSGQGKQNGMVEVPQVVLQSSANANPTPELKLGRRKTKEVLEETPELTVEEQAEKKKEEGNAEFKKKRYTAAINRYTEAIALNPKVCCYYSNRSLVHFQTKNYVQAAEDGEACVAADADFLKGYMRLASAQLELKDFVGAKATVRKGMVKDLNNQQLVQLLREIKEREWAAEEEGEEESMFSTEDVEEIEEVMTPGAEKAAQQEQERKERVKMLQQEKAERRQRREADQRQEAERSAQKQHSREDKAPLDGETVKAPGWEGGMAGMLAATPAKEQERVPGPLMKPASCIKGLHDARGEFEAELRGMWDARQEVFWQVWSDNGHMKNFGGREAALANVVINIMNYPKKPYGLEIDHDTFIALMPELSPPAVTAYDKDASRLFSVVNDVLKTKWDKDMDDLYQDPKLKHLVIEVGGYRVPLDEGKPISPNDADSVEFGSRLKLFSTIRRLFLHQSLFLAASIILAQAMEKKIIG